MADIPNSMHTDIDSTRLGADIPALGMRDGRPVNKKLIIYFVAVFILISVAIFFILRKVSNRNAGAVAKPEAQQQLALPPTRERIVPPLTSPSSPALAQNSATPLTNSKDAGAIPLASEKKLSAGQASTSSPAQMGKSGSPGTAPVLSLEEKRTKTGGGLMAGDGGAGTGVPDAVQSETGWKKRLQPSGAPGGESSEANSKISALPATAIPLPASATAAPGLAGLSAALAADPKNARLNALAASMGLPAGGAGPGGAAADGALASKLIPTDTSGLGTASRGKSASTVEAQRLSTDKNYLVPRGSNITCVLDSRLVSDLSGSASCTVNKNVYSMNGAYRLIPKGSRLSGTFKGGSGDNERLSVIWDRILTPEGIDIAISEAATDEMGSTGVLGDFDGHWGKKLSAAILVSLAGDLFKLGSVKYGPTQQTTTTDTAGKSTVEIKPYESIAVDILSKIPAQIAAKTLATPDTITIPQGQLVNVMTTKDIDFRQVRASL